MTHARQARHASRLLPWRHLPAWLAPLAVMALAAVLRLWALNRPDSLVFDEIYYVRDAISQLAHGYPTTWPDNDPNLAGDHAQAFSDMPNTIAHPPLGKWLIALGVLLFGADNGWGWRSAITLAGLATVALTMRLGWLLSRSLWVASVAGLCLAVDGVHVTLSRVALLDSALTLCVVLGAIFIWLDWQQSPDPRATTNKWQHVLKRPWLLAAGAAFGAAAAVKWSGLFALAAFLLLTVLRDILRYQWHQRGLTVRAVLRPLISAAVLAIPTAAVTYLLSWLGWILNTGGQFRATNDNWLVSLSNWHTHMLGWHTGLDAAHPYAAHPLGWPLGVRPTLMHYERAATGSGADFVSVISPIPNPLVTWGGVVALLLLTALLTRGAWFAVRTRSLRPISGQGYQVAAFVLCGYLAGWLPWVLLSSRSAVFQFYTVVMTPFAALALALVLWVFSGRITAAHFIATSRVTAPPSVSFSVDHGRASAVNIFLAATVALGLFFWPLWAAIPVPEWYYQIHLWLPGW